MIQAPGSNRHPLGQLAYRIISGNTWYDSQSVLQDQKVSLECLVPRPIISGHHIHQSDVDVDLYLDWTLPPHPATRRDRYPTPGLCRRSSCQLRCHEMGARHKIRLRHRSEDRSIWSVDRAGLPKLQHRWYHVCPRRTQTALCVVIFQSGAVRLPGWRLGSNHHLAAAPQISSIEVQPLEYDNLLCQRSHIPGKSEHRAFYGVYRRDHLQFPLVSVSSYVV